LSASDEAAPDEAAPARRTTMSWGKRRKPHLAADHAKRQGEITRLAFLLLGRDAAIAFLNTEHTALGGRPLDLATASDEGRNSVEAEIGRLAYAAPPAPTATLAIEGGSREVPGDRPRRSREPAEAHFRHMHDTRDARNTPLRAGGSD
jgi:hypothetical protein